MNYFWWFFQACYYRPPTKLREGNVFQSCQSVSHSLCPKGGGAYVTTMLRPCPLPSPFRAPSALASLPHKETPADNVQNLLESGRLAFHWKDFFFISSDSKYLLTWYISINRVNSGIITVELLQSCQCKRVNDGWGYGQMVCLLSIQPLASVTLCSPSYCGAVAVFVSLR